MLDDRLADRFIKPFYLHLLHGNSFYNVEQRSQFPLDQFRAASARIADEELERILVEREWRGRLCAAWFIGVGRRVQFIDRIGDLLLASELVYAGAGYCAALGLIGGERCEEILTQYLRKFLPPEGRAYDQLDAIAGLAYLNPSKAETLLTTAHWPSDEWPDDPRSQIPRFAALMEYVTSELLGET